VRGNRLPVHPALPTQPILFGCAAFARKFQ
jgi:hypothetical protein